MEDSLICLRDLYKFSEKMLFLAPNVFYICIMFDGEITIDEISIKYTKMFGARLTPEDLQGITDILEGVYFLESDNFQQRKETIIKEFRQSPRRKRRKASHAGPAYHGEPQELLQHSDLNRGSGCFVHSRYKLEQSHRVRTFVIFNISPIVSKRRFILTDKDYETPLGTLRAKGSLRNSLVVAGDLARTFREG